MTTEDPAALLLTLLAFAVLAVVAYAINEMTPAAEHGGKGKAEVDQLSAVAALREPAEGEVVLLAVIRQSGSVEREGLHASREQAMKRMQATFRRAKVPEARIWKNTEEAFEGHRMMHDHGGRKEGKKIGGVVLQVVRPEPQRA